MEKKLAISMFGQKRLSREGGIEIVVKELCTRMAQDGHKITCKEETVYHYLVRNVYVKTNYHFICYDVEPDYGAMDKRWSALYLQIVQTVQNASPAVMTTIFSSLKMVSVIRLRNMKGK